MADITVTVIHEGDQSILDCNECGALGFVTRASVSDDIYAHLKSHGCNMDTVNIRRFDTPEEQS